MGRANQTPSRACTLAAVQAVDALLRQACALSVPLVAALAAEAQARKGQAETSPSTGIEAPLQAATEHSAARHRREHRIGVPGKVESDPELEAFIRARIATLTFPQIAAEVASAFPPDRRASQSSIHRWWRRNRP